MARASKTVTKYWPFDLDVLFFMSNAAHKCKEDKNKIYVMLTLTF